MPCTAAYRNLPRLNKRLRRGRAGGSGRRVRVVRNGAVAPVRERRPAPEDSLLVGLAAWASGAQRG